MDSSLSQPGTSRSTRLSAIIIAKNEEDRIGPCLRALVGWADEIIVVDSGSEDRTVEISRRYTPRVMETHWRGYGKQKQFATEMASNEWVLSLDADEVVSSQLREEIDRALAGDSSVTAYRIPREYEVFGKVLRHGDCGRAPIRLFRRDRARFSEDLVHEGVITDGRVGRLRTRLTHFSYRDVDHALQKARAYATLWAAQQHDRGRRVNLIQSLGHSAWAFFRVFVLKSGWLDGRRGFILAVLQSQYTFNKYVTLWARQIEAESAAARALPRTGSKVLHAIENAEPETTTVASSRTTGASLRGPAEHGSHQLEDVPIGRVSR